MVASMSDIVQVDAGEKLHISVVESLHEQLESALSSHQGVNLDVSKVGQVDTASMQLLVAYQDAAAKAGLTFSLDSPTEAMLKGAELLGVKTLLGLK
jgi:ABC-type transporter Mla MlaB component